MYDLAIILFSLFVGYSGGKNRERKKIENEILKLQVENELLKDPNLNSENALKNLDNKNKKRFFNKIWDWIKM